LGKVLRGCGAVSIANTDFADFANHVEADGVFRGFPETPQKIRSKLLDLAVDSSEAILTSLA